MATLVLRLVKGSPLTNAEVDANFSNLNADIQTRLPSTSFTLSAIGAGNVATLNVQSGVQDQTYGRVMQVGAFGVGVPITLGDSVDLNTLTLPGIYARTADAGISLTNNYPTLYSGVLEVLSTNSTGSSGASGLFQRYTTYVNASPALTTYVRGSSDGTTWSAWSRSGWAMATGSDALAQAATDKVLSPSILPAITASTLETGTGTVNNKFVTPQGLIQSIGSQVVNTVNGRKGNVTLTASDVGLPLVNNTSDINKPISGATQSALNTKVNIASPSVTGNLTFTDTSWSVVQTSSKWSLFFNGVAMLSVDTNGNLLAKGTVGAFQAP